MKTTEMVALKICRELAKVCLPGHDLLALTVRRKKTCQ